MILSPEQTDIVNHKDGALLVIAGAGSGKTRVLTERIKKLLEVDNRNYRVLALTFSNKAADEMMERLKDIPDIEELSYISTIHKFCLEVVSTRGKSIGIDNEPHIFESNFDRREVLRNVFEKNPTLKNILMNQNDHEKFLNNILNYISQQKRNLKTPEYFKNQTNNDDKIFAEIYKEYDDFLRSQNAIEFDDILLFAYRIFTERPKIAEFYRKLYKYICIDEAQDLNYAQYNVIKSLCGSNFKNIMMVGDPKQAIYGFNGSDSNYMMKDFIEDFKPKEITLNMNYRSSKAIINAASKLNDSKNIIGESPIEGELEALGFSDESEEAEWVLEKLQYLLKNNHKDIEGDTTLERCAVLARNRYVFNVLEEKLKEKDIPYYFKKPNEYVESESNIMRVFELGLRIIINPFDIIHLQQLLELIGLEHSEQKKQGFELLQDLKNVINNNSEYFKFYPVLIKAWDQSAQEETDFGNALKGIKNFVESMDEIDDKPKSQILEDIEMWKNHWDKYVSKTISGQRTLVNFRNQVSLGETHDHSSNKGLALLTVHNSKGLEYDVIFIMGMNEGVFPDYRALKAGNKELKEELNNIFVAVTRSKRLCYLTYPLKKIMPWGDSKNQTPSQYIEKMELTSYNNESPLYSRVMEE